MYKATLYIVFLVAALTLLATDAMASDKVYRWVDENGNVHFSDQAPDKSEAEVIDIQPSPSSYARGNAEPDSVIFPEQPSRAQQVRDERAAKRLQDSETQQALAAGCEQRQYQVSQLEPSTRVMVTNVETGEVTRMDDSDRLEELSKAKAYIVENCNK